MIRRWIGNKDLAIGRLSLRRNDNLNVPYHIGSVEGLWFEIRLPQCAFIWDFKI